MKNQRGGLWRSRWAAIGAAVAVSLGSGGILFAHAVSSGASSFVPVTPCRLYDTRPAPNSTGGRSTPLAVREVVTLTVRGANGNCTIPVGATGVAANVTTVNGSAQSYLTIFPADAPQPNASTNNWVANQAATPNKVDSKLSVDGKIKVYNDAGTVDIIIDIVGYYEPVAPPGAPAGSTISYSGYSAVRVEAGTAGISPSYSNVFGCLNMPPAAEALMPLELPAGAQITTVTIRYRDDSAVGGDSTSFYLYHATVRGVSEIDDSVAPLNSDASALTGNITLKVHPPVGPNAVYYIYASSSGAGQAFCGADVTYTL